MTSRLDDDAAAAGRMEDIQKADPDARRASRMIVAVGAVLGGALITIAGALRPDLEAWVKQDVNARWRIVISALTLLTAGPLLGMAVYLWRLGQRIIRAQRYPPPGLKVVRDTRVVIGEAAGRWGRAVQTFGVVMGVIGLLLTFFLWRLFFLLRTASA